MNMEKQNERRCDRCIVRFLNCDGNPKCNRCSRFAKLKNLPSINCTYNNQPVESADQKFMFTNHSLQSLASTYQSTNASSPSSRSYNSNGTIVMDESEISLKSLRIELNDIHSDVHKHLIDISFLASYGYTLGDDLRLQFPLEEREGLCTNMRIASMFTSLFFSTHPKIFTKTEDMTIEGRLQLALKLFSQQVDVKDLKHQSISRQCDEVRALFTLGFCYGGLGLKNQATENILKGFDVAKELSLLDPKTFAALDSKKSNHISVDDLVAIVADVNLEKKSKALNVKEQLEIYILLAFLFSTQTRLSLSSGRNFVFDDSKFLKLHISHPQIKIPYSRRHIPNLARNTIWENTHWAPTFDEMKELSYMYPTEIADAGQYANRVIKFTHLLREIIRFSRQYQYDATDIDQEFRMDLHMKLIQTIKLIPEDISYFDSLEPFLYGSTKPLPSLPKFRNFHRPFDFAQSLLIMLTYLHFNCAQRSDMVLFPASVGGVFNCTAKDILFATGKALGHVLHSMTIPMNPRDSCFGLYDYQPDMLELCLSNPGHPMIPSPVVAAPGDAFGNFSVTSSALVAMNAQPINMGQREELFHIAETIVLPAMQRTVFLWPWSNMYLLKLKQLLSMK
ncbi:hypothetical protein BC833DRAFT_596682 [Globomyces pollinis-pini]|nr:hypothetical protein BC833DRAFT_596682 [Globomyces pollinis-pini]